jgi:hypothetical protein
MGRGVRVVSMWIDNTGAADGWFSRGGVKLCCQRRCVQLNSSTCLARPIERGTLIFQAPNAHCRHVADARGAMRMPAANLGQYDSHADGCDVTPGVRTRSGLCHQNQTPQPHPKHYTSHTVTANTEMQEQVRGACVMSLPQHRNAHRNRRWRHARALSTPHEHARCAAHKRRRTSSSSGLAWRAWQPQWRCTKCGQMQR